jgi:hypothetical protein
VDKRTVLAPCLYAHKNLRPLDGMSLCSGVLTGVDCGIFAALVEEHAG